MSHDHQVSPGSLTERARTLLAEGCRLHGLQPRVDGSTLYLGAGPPAARCAVESYRSYPNGAWMVQLTVEVAPGIQDTRAGIGFSPDEALVEAITAWLHGTLAPILAAGRTEDETVRTRFGLEGPRSLPQYLLDMSDRGSERATTWAVYSGPFQMRGDGAHRRLLAERLEESPPLTTLLLEALVDFLARFERPVAWLKLLLHRDPDGSITSECKLNNEDWTLGLQRLSEFSWPAAALSGPVSFQQFIVLARGEIKTGRVGPSGRP